MGFKFNPFTGTLDLVEGGVSRVGNTNDKRIVRWKNNNSDTIENSLALVQDGGSVVAQGFITKKLITDTILIESNNVMVTSGFSIELDGELIIESDGELVLV